MSYLVLARKYRPQTFDDLAGTVVDRILDLAGFENVTYRWSAT